MTPVNGVPTRWEWMKAVLDPEGGPEGSTVRLTLLALGSHMDRAGGSCWPSCDLLARETRLGERTIRRDLQDAVLAGWIEREKKGRGWCYQARIPGS